MGFLVDKVALGQVFSEYFGFSCQFSFHLLLHTHYLSSGAGTIGQSVADVPSGLSLTPPQETKKKEKPYRRELEYYEVVYSDSCEHGSRINITFFCYTTPASFIRSLWCFRKAWCPRLQRRRAKVEATGSSDTWGHTCQTTHRHFPEENNLNLHRHETSYLTVMVLRVP
jgi:hypothetical protein